MLLLIIEYESQKVLSLAKKTTSFMSKDKELSLQTYINSLLSSYSATGKLESHREANQIIKLLNYLTKIKKILGDKNNSRRFEDVLNLLNDTKLIPWAEADNENYVISNFLKFLSFLTFFKMDFFIMLQKSKSGKVYLEVIFIF